MQHPEYKDDTKRCYRASHIVRRHPEVFLPLLMQNKDVQNPLHTLLSSDNKRITRNLKPLISYALSLPLTLSEYRGLINALACHASTNTIKQFCSQLYTCKDCYTPVHTSDNHCVSCNKILISESTLADIAQDTFASIAHGEHLSDKTKTCKNLIISKNFQGLLKGIVHQRIRHNALVSAQDLFTQGQGIAGILINNLTRNKLTPNSSFYYYWVRRILSLSLAWLDTPSVLWCEKNKQMEECYRTISALIPFLKESFFTAGAQRNYRNYGHESYNGIYKDASLCDDMIYWMTDSSLLERMSKSHVLKNVINQNTFTSQSHKDLVQTMWDHYKADYTRWCNLLTTIKNAQHRYLPEGTLFLKAEQEDNSFESYIINELSLESIYSNLLVSFLKEEIQASQEESYSISSALKTIIACTEHAHENKKLTHNMLGTLNYIHDCGLFFRAKQDNVLYQAFKNLLKKVRRN